MIISGAPGQSRACFGARRRVNLARPKRDGVNMAKLAVGDTFPSGSLKDIDGVAVDFPAVFEAAPATVVFFYRGRW